MSHDRPGANEPTVKREPRSGVVVSASCERDATTGAVEDTRTEKGVAGARSLPTTRSARPPGATSRRRGGDGLPSARMRVTSALAAVLTGLKTEMVPVTDSAV